MNLNVTSVCIMTNMVAVDVLVLTIANAPVAWDGNPAPLILSVKKGTAEAWMYENYPSIAYTIME